jgi:hypothetical protein
MSRRLVEGFVDQIGQHLGPSYRIPIGGYGFDAKVCVTGAVRNVESAKARFTTFRIGGDDVAAI